MPTFPIREAIPATPRAHILRLDLQGQSFPYRAGQAAYLQPHGADKRRPYSMASAPEETARHGLLEFLVQTGADSTSGLTPDLIRPGTSVVIEGPLGSFTFPEHPRERRFVFIAGGTGIAPLRSMLWHALLAERDGHVGLIYSVRSPEEFAYMQEFQRLEDDFRGPEPLDAWRRFLEDSRARGDFRLGDPSLDAPFWRYFVANQIHSFYPPGSVAEAQALRTPPWAGVR